MEALGIRGTSFFGHTASFNVNVQTGRIDDNPAESELEFFVTYESIFETLVGGGELQSPDALLRQRLMDQMREDASFLETERNLSSAHNLCEAMCASMAYEGECEDRGVPQEKERKMELQTPLVEAMNAFREELAEQQPADVRPALSLEEALALRDRYMQPA
jgi:hypothetical protein